MENVKVIINSIFNVKDYEKNGEQRFTDEWIDERINIFTKYTLQSLKAQTNQDFKFYIRYQDSTEDSIFNSLSKHEILPDNVQFVPTTKYDEIVKNEIKDYAYVYFVRLDSDDMYHKSYVQQMYDYIPKKDTVALINRNGYIFDSVNNRFAKCYGKVVTFYTFIYKVKDYLCGDVASVDSTDIDNEQYIALRFPHEFITKRNYIWHIHSSNTITEFENWFTYTTNKTSDEDIINKVLKEFMAEKNEGDC